MDAISNFCKVTIALAYAACVCVPCAAAACPFGSFDGASSGVAADAMNDGVVLTRYASKIVNAPMLAGTRYANVAALTPAQVVDRIDAVSCALDMNGDGAINTVDSTIITRYLLGFKGAALTAGLLLGSGLRSNATAVADFVASGCAVVTPCVSAPTTYYVSPNGSDAAAGTNASPWRTFAKAFSIMASGETLIVKSGTYTESLGAARQPAAGTPGKFTTIRAETDGGAVIDGQGLVMPLLITHSYVRIEGMKFINGESLVATLNGNHLHILRSAFANAGPSTYDGVMDVGGNDVLVEDSWMWGRGKAGVFVTGARSTLRRLVIRMDYYAGTLGFIGVVLSGDYDTLIGADNTVIENVIVLDQGTTSSPFDWKGGFRSRDLTNARTHRYFGTIVLNSPYDGYRMSDSHYENVVAWNVAGRGGLYEDTYKSGYTVKNATVGVSSATGILTNLTGVSNSIMYRISGSNSAGEFNVYNQTAVPSGATNTITSDPQLKYITRIENGSAAFASGQNGAHRGATIVNRYQDGVLTSIPLWPWPNEARIKTDFQTNFGLPGVNPQRGFAANGRRINGAALTLSSYIWEYLGNPCPAAMCD